MATMQYRRNPRASTLHRFYAVLASGLLAGSGALALPSAAAGAAVQPACSPPPPAAEPIPELPWAQRWFAPERVWPLSRGRGVVVAVLDSGVDPGHPQLDDGRVLAGTDRLPDPAGAHVDCDSHGTAVASIIAASQVDRIGFAGLAPGAEILPVRVAERDLDTTRPDQPPPVDPDTFAGAIRWAADQRAQVINVSVVFYRDHAGIADAVRDAVDRGIVVVAAVGQQRADDGSFPTPYPAAYPGVVGVGSIGYSGGAGDEATLTAAAYAGPHVDLVAPGEAVVVAAAGRDGHHRLAGTSFATPFVSAAAALVLAAEPGLTGPEVVGRLLATADPGPGSPEVSGHGVVNPYRALTERRGGGEPLAGEPPPAVAVDPVAEDRADRWQRTGTLAALIAVGALVLAVLALGGRAAGRRGRDHGWRPTHRLDPPPGESPVAAPERAFFTVPTRRNRR